MNTLQMYSVSSKVGQNEAVFIMLPHENVKARWCSDFLVSKNWL